MVDANGPTRSTPEHCHIAREDRTPEEARQLPRHPVPAVLLARLAIARDEQRHGHGQRLLVDAIMRTAVISKESGVYALVVDAKDEAAKAYYEQRSFVAILDRPMTLYLPLATALMAMDQVHGRKR